MDPRMNSTAYGYVGNMAAPTQPTPAPQMGYQATSATYAQAPSAQQPQPGYAQAAAAGYAAALQQVQQATANYATALHQQPAPSPALQQQQQQQPLTSVVSQIYQQRPTFGEDGKGLPYSALLDKCADSRNQDISYDTSSKDPVMMRARVFIGNLQKTPVTREDLIDLFRPMGNLLALTFFKGYAFVQFADAKDADYAVQQLDGKRWKGTVINVHLALLGKEGRKRPNVHVDSYGIVTKLSKYDSVQSGYYQGKAKEDPYGAGGGEDDDTAAQNKKNRHYAIDDTTRSEELFDTGMADTLICGGCRFVTCDFEQYRDHRVNGCGKHKDPTEPDVLKCASCHERFNSAWALMVHLTDFHRMMLYTAEKKEDREPVEEQNGGGGGAKPPHEEPKPSFTPMPTSYKVGQPVNQYGQEERQSEERQQQQQGGEYVATIGDKQPEQPAPIPIEAVQAIQAIQAIQSIQAISSSAAPVPVHIHADQEQISAESDHTEENQE